MEELDYTYAAPDLREWLRRTDPASVSLQAVFDAGERYGADAERGAIFGELPNLRAEAEEDGIELAYYVQKHLVISAKREMGVDTTDDAKRSLDGQ